MIKRRRDYAKREPSRDAHKIYIVCEGLGTEPKYFAFFEGLSSNLQIITIPPENGTDPLKLMEQAQKQLCSTDQLNRIDYMHRDTVWFVIDTDTWEQEGKIEPLRQFCQTMNEVEAKYYPAWNVAQSNPSFEIWLYYHFESEQPNILENQGTFKEFINSVISGGFNYDVDPVRLRDAISNAQANYHLDELSHPQLYSTEVFLLGKEIEPFVKTELGKLKNKLG